jgi:hypothetical protein
MRIRKITPQQFNLSELMPSIKKAKKYLNDDEKIYLEHVC